MQRSLFARASVLALAVTAVTAMACSNDSTETGLIVPAAAKGTTGTTGGDTAGSAPTSPATPTSNGPVVSVRLTPHAIITSAGNYVFVYAEGLDAQGAHVLNKPAKFTTPDASILTVVNDTGAVKAIAVGTAKLYATIDGHTDSATVTVIAATTPPATPPTQQPAVASFDLTAKITAPVAGTDTSSTTPVAGALVRLTRTGGLTGDTLATSIDAGSATTDANGAVSFKGLAGGAYEVDIAPPAGSNLTSIKTGFAPPRQSSVNMIFLMRPKN